MPEYRIEKDFLGTKEVPVTAYFGIQTLRAVENFPITGYPPHVESIIAIGYVKKAAAMANMEVGGLNSNIANAIIRATEEIIEGKLHDQFIVDSIQGGAGTSFNMNANEVIANRAIELLGGEKGDYKLVSPNTHVNMSQSTNDVFPTAMHIAVFNLAKGLISVLYNLKEELEKKEIEFDDVIKMGKTHLQDAVPIRLGQEFGAYAKVIGRDITRIKQSIQHLDEINMGATAVGTGLNAKSEYIRRVVEILSELTGHSLRDADSLVDATQNTDAYTEVSSSLKILAINLSKIANDLRLMSSGPATGFNEINLPPRQPGSSMMPGKVNPVIAEVINQICFQVIGNDHTISLASEAGQLELNVMEPVLVFNLLQSLSILQNGIKAFKDYLIVGITANKERCRQLVENNIGIVTAINPHVGYEVATQIVQEAFNTGKTVRGICLDRELLTEEQLEAIFDVKEMTSPGVAGAKLIKGTTIK